MSDAKALDAQYGQEKAMTSLAAALAGGNLIYESSGMTASLLGASLEAFVIDDEMHAANYRILRGVEVNDDTLCYDAICSAVLNDGHFLGAQTTIDSMERDYLYPGLMDRQTPQGWFEGGELDLWQRAKGSCAGDFGHASSAVFNRPRWMQSSVPISRLFRGAIRDPLEPDLLHRH